MGKKRRRAVLLILTLAFIWGNSMLSKEASGALSGAVMEDMNTAARWLGLGEDFFSFMPDDSAEQAEDFYIRKAAHVTEFAVLAALLWGVFEEKDRRALRTFGTAVLCAAADETIQIFSHRGSRVRDVFIDAAGALLGLGIASLIGRIKQNGRV